MSWQAYKLVYRARSPIHIGYRALGFIQRTRYYIPGRAMWGAFTANLTRAYASYTQYEAIGRDVHRDLRFSYFYPALDAASPLLPRFTTKGLQFGDPDRTTCYSQDSFERLFVGAFGQTAVEPESSTAEEGSLHETEFLSAAVAVDRGHRPVFFVGYVFLREGANIAGSPLHWDHGERTLLPAIKEIFVGGERKYGFGRLVLDTGELGRLAADGAKVFGHTLLLGNDVSMEVGKDKPVPAHLAPEGALNLKGDVEPLVGREWGVVGSGEGSKVGAGQVVSNACLCWVPGSIALERMPLRIGDYGVLVAGGA